MVVVEFAKSSRARCHSCNSCIGEGNLKFGTAINNDGYLNMQWHHQGCFWNRRAAKYYRRRGKKVNYLLNIKQFSNTEILSPDQYAELEEKILHTNLKYGTDEALAKAGIVRPNSTNGQVEDDSKSEAEEKASVRKGRKRKATPSLEEDESETSKPTNKTTEVVIDPECASGGRVTRSRAKKMMTSYIS